MPGNFCFPAGSLRKVPLAGCVCRKGSPPGELTVRWDESFARELRYNFAPAIVSFTLRRFENVCVL